MLYKILFATVLAVAAAASPGSHACPPQETDQLFKLSDMCGETITVKYQAGFPSETSCIIVQYLCNRDETITVYAHIFVDGYLNGTGMTLLTEVGQGILERKYLTQGYTATEYIIAYEMSCDGNIKVTTILCEEGNSEPTQILMLSNYDADFTGDLAKVSRLAPSEHVIKMPNKCSPYKQTC